MMNEQIARVRIYVQSRGEVSVSELQSLYEGYSSMTIWRDLKQLERRLYSPGTRRRHLHADSRAPDRGRL